MKFLFPFTLLMNQIADKFSKVSDVPAVIDQWYTQSPSKLVVTELTGHVINSQVSGFPLQGGMG